MERVAEIAGVMYINDTTATAPVATAAALEALGARAGRVHLLAGGADKGLDPTPIADAAARYGALVYLFAGTATAALERALRERGVDPAGPFDSMEAAVGAARFAASVGDMVLLSPGCASFGLFRDEFDRGERFRETVRALTPNPPPGGSLSPLPPRRERGTVMPRAPG
jgi:UDP-N-acetylmuramoylalanine--D-glutamate ligase